MPRPVNLRNERTTALLKYVAAHPQGLREDSAITFMSKVCESSRGGLYVVKDAEVRQLVAGRFRVMHITPEGKAFLREHDGQTTRVKNDGDDPSEDEGAKT